MQGLKKFEDDDNFLNYCRKYEIIAMYETWQRNINDFSSFLEGYINFDCLRPSKRTAQRGSGGVTVFVKDLLVNKNIIKRICDEMTECIVLLLNGDFFEVINDIILIFTYVAPERSPIYSPENDDGIVILNEKLTNIKSSYPNAEIILAGDLNARTKDFLDYIPYDDLDFIFGETDYPGDTLSLDRNSKDANTYNKFGLSLIDLCCEHDIHMLNGHISDDVEGNFTCISNEGRSLVDYIIASSSLFDKFSYFCIDTHDFSDHFPVTCTLRLQQSFNEGTFITFDNDAETSNWGKFKWKESLKQDFLDKFRAKYVDFKNMIQFNQNNVHVTQYLKSFVNVFQQAGDPMKIKFSKHGSNKVETAQPEWWDQSCSLQKSKKFKALRKFRTTDSEGDFQQYKAERNHFKSLCKVKKKEFQKKRRSVLIEARNRPKDFWKTIKANNKVSTRKTEISNSDWVNYFRTLFSPPETRPEINQDHPLQNITQDTNTYCLDIPITEMEIRRAISK